MADIPGELGTVSLSSTCDQFISLFYVCKLSFFCVLCVWLRGRNNNFMEQTLSCEANSTFSVFYGNQWFITVSTRTRHWFLSRAALIQSSLQLCFCKVHFNISIYFYFLRLSFSSGFLIKILYFSPIPTTRPAHLTVLNMFNLIIFGEEHELWSF
jgi:hypothetical protein